MVSCFVKCYIPDRFKIHRVSIFSGIYVYSVFNQNMKQTKGMIQSCSTLTSLQNHHGLIESQLQLIHKHIHPQPMSLGNAPPERPQGATQTRNIYASSHCLRLNAHSRALQMPLLTQDSDPYTPSWLCLSTPFSCSSCDPDQGSHSLLPCFHLPPFPSPLPYPNAFTIRNSIPLALNSFHSGEMPIKMHYSSNPSWKQFILIWERLSKKWLSKKQLSKKAKLFVSTTQGRDPKMGWRTNPKQERRPKMRSEWEPKAHFPTLQICPHINSDPGAHVLVQTGQHTNPACVFWPGTLKPLQPSFLITYSPQD